MANLHTVLVVLQVAAAISMIIFILLQHGKGADMGSSFGSGAATSLFGASGGANFLSRTTAVFAVIFFASTLGQAVMQGGMGDGSSNNSVLEIAAPAAPTNPAAAIPSSLPSASPAPDTSEAANTSATPGNASSDTQVPNTAPGATTNAASKVKNEPTPQTTAPNSTKTTGATKSEAATSTTPTAAPTKTQVPSKP